MQPTYRVCCEPAPKRKNEVEEALCPKKTPLNKSWIQAGDGNALPELVAYSVNAQCRAVCVRWDVGELWFIVDAVS